MIMENTNIQAYETKPIPVMVKTETVDLPGDLVIPEDSKGLIIFAHGSGSSRFSPRNRAVAASLNKAGLGTLLFDLLTARENEVDEETCEYRFNIDLLGIRLTQTLDWLLTRKDTVGMNIGVFGASTGAAAALIAATERPERVHAVVSRGGRPDLAKEHLARVRTPSLFIVGEDDASVVAMNRSALYDLRCEKKLEIIPGANHLFEEPGKLDDVATLAKDWFTKWIE